MNQFLIIFPFFISVQLATSANPNLNPGIVTSDILLKSKRILEHISSAKCISLNNDKTQLLLETCVWDQGSVETESVLSILKGNGPGGYLFRWSLSQDQGATKGCLALRSSQEDEEEEGKDFKLRQDSSSDETLLEECDPKAPKQNWELYQVSKGEYLVKEFRGKRCLTIEESEIQATSCDKQDKDQLWRVCENKSEIHSCDA